MLTFPPTFALASWSTLAQCAEWSEYVVDYLFDNLTYFAGVLGMGGAPIGAGGHDPHF